MRDFCAIVECRGLSAAQLLLDTSQSALSANLAKLEHRVGARLCNRGRSGFMLTEAGRAVYAAAQRLFEAVTQFDGETGGLAANLKGRLRLGIVDAIVTNTGFPLPAIIGRFRDKARSVAIHLWTSSPEELEHKLASGGCDIVIAPYMKRNSELHYTPLFGEKQTFLCSRSHPLFDLTDAQITRQRLRGYDFAARGYLHRFDLARIGHREAAATVETMEAQLILILSGKFIGYLPEHYAASRIAAGELKALGSGRFDYESPFYAVRQRGRGDTRVVGRFMAELTG